MAVCVYSIDIGEQLCNYQDKSQNYKDQFVLGFELVGFTYEEDGVQKPYDLSKTLAASKHPKSAVYQLLTAWNGREPTEEELNAFDTNEFVGRTAMVNVIVKENGFNDIQGIFRIPEGFPTPAATMPFITFDMDPWDQAAFERLPEWAQKRIKKSTQYQKQHAPTDVIAVQSIQSPVNMMANFVQPPMQSPQAVRNDMIAGVAVGGSAYTGGVMPPPYMGVVQSGSAYMTPHQSAAPTASPQGEAFEIATAQAVRNDSNSSRNNGGVPF